MEFEPLERVPYHVGVIMDGNGRWAKQRGKPRIEGHRAGTNNIRPVLESCVRFGVKMLTIYAFSTENWKRPSDEVQGLMGIVDMMIDRELMNLHKNGVQLRHIGELEGIDPRLKKKVLDAIELTRNNDRIILNVAFNYGGRAEIMYAVRRIIRDGIEPDEVTEELLSGYMYTAGSPDPDLIIRTSGEFRTSNFLIWQGAYAEYYVTPTYWPDFDEVELYRAIEAYSKRDRRFGDVNSRT